MSFFRSILVSGGAGFIGSNFVHYIASKHPECRIIVLDDLTYAGNLENLAGLIDTGRVEFVKGSVYDADVVKRSMKGCEAVFNFAAETHVDRSIQEAGTFIDTDVRGTYTMLRAALDAGVKRFVQISTDEVYGSSAGDHFTEEAPLKPGNPYSASKCGGDLMCQAFFNTFRLPVVVTRSSNNFGPYQHVEKFIPLFITNTIEGKPLPLYGDGMHERDWLFVEDNCSAIELVARERDARRGLQHRRRQEPPESRSGRADPRRSRRAEVQDRFHRGPQGPRQGVHHGQFEDRVSRMETAARFRDGAPGHRRVVPEERTVVAAGQVGGVPRILRKALLRQAQEGHDL